MHHLLKNQNVWVGMFLNITTILLMLRVSVPPCPPPTCPRHMTLSFTYKYAAKGSFHSKEIVVICKNQRFGKNQQTFLVYSV